MQGTTVTNKSPRFMKLTEYDGRAALCYSYVYGKEIYETVNEFYKEAGLGTRLSIPSQENRTIRFLKDSSYHCEITEDNRLRLVCAAGE